MTPCLTLPFCLYWLGKTPVRQLIGQAFDTEICTWRYPGPVLPHHNFQNCTCLLNVRSHSPACLQNNPLPHHHQLCCYDFQLNHGRTSPFIGIRNVPAVPLTSSGHIPPLLQNAECRRLQRRYCQFAVPRLQNSRSGNAELGGANTQAGTRQGGY